MNKTDYSDRALSAEKRAIAAKKELESNDLPLAPLPNPTKIRGFPSTDKPFGMNTI